MKIAAITDIGSCRQENQDNYCAQQLAGGTAWGIVCDGMGGVNGGRIAARIATDTMQQYFARGYTPKAKPGKHCNACSLKSICLPVLCSRADPVSYLRAHIFESEEDTP